MVLSSVLLVVSSRFQRQSFSFSELPGGIQILAYLLGAVVGYYVLMAVLNAMRHRGAAKSGSLSDIIQRKFFPQAFEVRKAEGAMRSSNYLVAGEIYEKLGMNDAAIKAYMDGQEFVAAAQLHEQLKHVDQAINCYVQGRDYSRGAQLALATGRAIRAAEILESSHNLDKAAEVYLQAQNFPKAAELLERAGAYGQAAHAYEKAGMLLKAAQSYEAGFQQTRGFSGGPGSSGLTKEGARMALAAAQLYDRGGDTNKAIEICSKEKLLKEAGHYASKAKRYKEAASFYGKIPNYEKAAEMLELAGDRRGAATMRAEGQIAAGNQAEAANWFDAAGDYIRAAELYEWEKRYREAAACYLKNDSFIQAAEAYLKAEDRGMAAQMYERGGDFEQAASLYLEMNSLGKASEFFEKAGKFYEAGMTARKCNDDDRALGLLQKVPPSEERYATACSILGELFVAREQYDLAIDRYMKATSNQPIGSGNVELYYLMAGAMESGGKKSDALHVYKRIWQEDYSYKDVKERIKRLEAEVSRPDAPRVDGTGALTAVGEGGAAESGQRAAYGDVPPHEDVDRYLVMSKIGEGGMGVIYKAQDKILKRIVALKILSHPVHTDQKVVDRFFTEARSAAALNHPNIVTIFDVGKLNRNYFISMEFIEGQNFMALIEKWKKLSMPQFLFLGKYLCEALDYAHKQKVIHRDIKPTNIMLTKGGQIKITDFGLAKVLDDSSATETGAVSGTPYYMSPEQIQGKRVDHKTDLYSLGATLYHLLAGAPPFQTERVLYQHLFEKPVAPSKLRDDIPALCDKILLKCLEKDPDKRYKDAMAVLNDLKKLERS